jgi:hypothetical protein
VLCLYSSPSIIMKDCCRGLSDVPFGSWAHSHAEAGTCCPRRRTAAVVRRGVGWSRSDDLVAMYLPTSVLVEHRGRWFLVWPGSWPLQPESFPGVPGLVK